MIGSQDNLAPETSIPVDRRDEIIRLGSMMIGTAIVVSAVFLGVVGDHALRDSAWPLVIGAFGGSFVYGSWRDVFRSRRNSGNGAHVPKAATKLGQWIERYW